MMLLIKHNTARILITSALLVLGVSPLHAQTIYRIVGSDGRVTFSDKPPSSGDQTSALGTGGRAAASDTGSEGLPFELRQIASRFPVTLYSGDNCAPCNSGRALLLGRGIPFAERTVATPRDGEALQRLSGDTSLPFLTIGGQKVRGFLESEWTQFLDAAGYPKSPQLPASYRNPPPAPLLAVPKPAGAAAGAGRATPEAERPPAPVSSPDNPAGIIF